MSGDKDEEENAGGDSTLHTEELVDGLNGYFKDNSYLFLLIGVFSTFTVYLTQIPFPESDGGVSIENLGIASSFGIVLLLCGIAFMNLVHDVYENDDRLLSKRNIGFVIFGYLLLALSLTIITAISIYSDVWRLSAFLLTYVVSFLTFSYMLDKFEESGIPDIVDEKLGIGRLGSLFIFSFLLLLSTSIVEYHLDKRGMAISAEEIGTLDTLREQFFLSTFQMLYSIWGGLAGFLIITIILLTTLKTLSRNSRRALSFLQEIYSGLRRG
ncbi:hypothetical protein [Natrinema altunense]|uniref:Uncharacterized protein n=1 Tax=Natrinema altunense TaxID=222984 RepID=A0A482XTW7_9EURY|nr:hypothetical protein [Natrinema altunense]RZH66469.1 hypothetical protein ELS17_17495 [Natrinema altunense]